MAEVMAAARVAVAGATAPVACRARPRMTVYFYGRAAADATFRDVLLRLWRGRLNFSDALLFMTPLRNCSR